MLLSLLEPQKYPFQETKPWKCIIKFSSRMIALPLQAYVITCNFEK